MDIVTAFVKGFEDYDVVTLQNTIKFAKKKNQSVLYVFIYTKYTYRFLL